MATRPYLQKSILGLEAIFERSANDANELGQLANELTFRNTAKARSLAVKIDEALAELASQKVVAISSSGAAARRIPPRPTSSANPRSKPSGPALKVVSAIPKVSPKPIHPPSAQIDLGPLPTFERMGKKNDPRAILAAWTALEALSPQGYKRPEDMASGDRSRVTLFERGVPWGPDARSKPNHRLYFEVVLGAIALDKATDELVKVFGKDEERSRPDGKRAAFGSILIGKEGFVLEENGVAVSSFAWALKPALELKLGSLGAWPKVEQRILERLDHMVRRHDDEGNPIPIDLDLVHRAHHWLVSQFEVPGHLVEPPTFALKIFHHFKAKTPPEPSLLNSFYLEDLAKASELIGENGAGVGLRRYLGTGRPDDRVDVLSPAAVVEPFVAPSLMPQGILDSSLRHAMENVTQERASRAAFAVRQRALPL